MKNNLLMVVLTTIFSISSFNLDVYALSDNSGKQSKIQNKVTLKQSPIKKDSTSLKNSFVEVIKKHKKASIISIAVFSSLLLMFYKQEKLTALFNDLKSDEDNKNTFADLNLDNNENFNREEINIKQNTNEENNLLVINSIENILNDEEEIVGNSADISGDIPSDDEDREDDNYDYISSQGIIGSRRHACPSEEDDRVSSENYDFFLVNNDDLEPFVG